MRTITSALLNNLRTGFSAIVQAAQDQMKAESKWARVATYVPSSDLSETYGWLKDDNQMREWIGPRVIKSLTENAQIIVNKAYENTISVNRYNVLFDKLGIYTPRFKNMGRAAQQLPDVQSFALLKAGFSTNCWDGQYFFDTDHPLTAADGTVTTWANTDGGSGNAWFLVDTTKGLLPIIFQEAIPPTFVAKDNPDDERVFMNNEFVYGMDCFQGFGYGLPQVAWGSKQTLDAAHVGTARATMGALKGEGGQPLGITLNVCLVGPSNEMAAVALFKNQFNAAGASNPYFGLAEVVVVPWLD